MGVLAELSISAEDFPLGSALGSNGDVEIALEAVVPVLAEVAPYVWVRGSDPVSFEGESRTADGVVDLVRLDRAGDDTLYRVEWSPEADGVLARFAEHGAAVLEATRLGRWRIRARFHDNDRLRGFYETCRDDGVDVSVTRVSVVEGPTVRAPAFDLAPRQREALLLALEAGHFEVPRRTDVSAIAAELGISRRVTSHRIRRGIERILQAALVGPGNRPHR